MRYGIATALVRHRCRLLHDCYQARSEQVSDVLERYP